MLLSVVAVVVVLLSWGHVEEVTSVQEAIHEADSAASTSFI